MLTFLILKKKKENLNGAGTNSTIDVCNENVMKIFMV